MSKKDEALEKEKRIKEHLLTLSKEQIIELYLQVKFERDYLEAQYVPDEDEYKYECFCCHKKIHEFSRWHKGQRVCEECLLNLFIPEQIMELENRLENSVELPSIQECVHYPDIDSMYAQSYWYVVYKNKSLNKIMTIKCVNKESAEAILEEIKLQNQRKYEINILGGVDDKQNN